MYNGFLPVPDSLGEPVDGLRGAHLNKLLLELRAEKKMSSLSVMPEIENSNSKNVLHHSASIHLIPVGTDLIVSPSGLGILSSAQNDQQKLKKPRTQIYMDLS